MEKFTIGEDSANILSIMIDFRHVFDRAIAAANSYYGDNTPGTLPVLDSFNAANDALFGLLKNNIRDSIGKSKLEDIISI